MFAFNLLIASPNVAIFVAACLFASVVPVICLVQSLTVPAPSARIEAAAAFSVPNTCANAVASLLALPNSCNLSESGIAVFETFFISTPRDFNFANASFGITSSPAILPSTFRNAVPASAPTLPPAANTCIAAFVSSNDTFAFFACTPATNTAWPTCGISAAPTLALAANTFMYRVDSATASFGFATSTPNCNIEFASTSILCAASNPPAFASTFMLSATLPNASGVFAKSAPNFDNTP